MKIRKLIPLFALLLASGAQAGLVNGGFELPALNANTYLIMNETAVLGWKTTASDHQIEIWSHGFNGVPSYQGDQHAELNANQVATLYQDVTGIAAGARVGYQFAHRGRSGVDTMGFKLTDFGNDGLFGTSDDAVLFSGEYSDGPDAWRFYSGTGIVALGHTVRFSFISLVGSSVSVGNFLDAADFGVGVGSSVPEPFTLGLLGLGLAGLGFGRRRKA